MKFLLRHMLLVVASALGGVFLCFGLNRLFQNKAVADRFNAVLEGKRFLSFAAFLLGIFLLWGYVLPKTFYFPFNDGVLGDNYHYISVVSGHEFDYYQPHHIVYPWLASKTVQFAEKLGFLAQNAPTFPETVYWMSAIPSKFIMLAALLFFAWSLKSIGLKWFDALLGIFWIAASAAYWLYGHQTAALGYGFAAQLFASAVFFLWRNRSGTGLIAALGAALALCIFAHIATLYFVFAGYLCVVFLLLTDKMLSVKNKVLHLLAFHAPILALAYVFYRMAAHSLGSSDPVAIFHFLGSTHDAGEFSFRVGKVLKAITDNLVTGIANVLNFWDKDTGGGWLAVFFLQTSCVVALAASIFWEGLRNFKINREVAFPLLTSLVTFLCFIPWRTGTHYYTVATIPNMLLLFFLLFNNNTESVVAAKHRVLLMVLIGTMVFYSGFSPVHVFQGKSLDELAYYRAVNTVSGTLAPDETALFFRPFKAVYAEEALYRYYRPKFKRIDLRYEASEWSDPQKFLDRLKDASRDPHTKIFLSDEVLRTVQAFRPGIKTEHLVADVNWLSGI